MTEWKPEKNISSPWDVDVREINIGQPINPELTVDPDTIMTEHNLPDKDDAPWLDTTYDGFMTGAELGFTHWFNDDTYGPYSYRCEWFFGDCEVEDEKTRKDLLYKWIHAAYCAGYEQGVNK